MTPKKSFGEKERKDKQGKQSTGTASTSRQSVIVKAPGRSTNSSTPQPITRAPQGEGQEEDGSGSGTGLAAGFVAGLATFLYLSQGASSFDSAATFEYLRELSVTPTGGFYVASIASFMAEATTCPLDTIKVRLQVTKDKGQNIISMGSSVIKNDGVAKLWQGVVPGATRQLVYGGLRLGMYGPAKEFLFAVLPFPTPITRFLSGMATGILGTVAANPLDVVKVRMQQGKFSSIPSAFTGILTNEGPQVFYSGLVPNCTRGATVTAVEMAAFDTFKDMLEFAHMGPVPLAVVAGALAGVFTTLFVSPSDVIKSRSMSSSELSYFELLKKLIEEEGPLGLYNGFVPNCARIGGFAVVMFGTQAFVHQLFL